MSDRIEPTLDPDPSAVPPAPPLEPEVPLAPPRKKRRWLRVLLVLLLLLMAVLGGLVWYEVRTSTLQAHVFADLAKDVHFKVEKGPSNAIRFPSDSPYDERLGYANLPEFLAKLKSKDYVVEAQARMSPKMRELIDLGAFATYHEKTQVGLSILDCHAEPMYSVRFPERSYARFEDAPDLLVKTLLFIENRELLDPAHPKRNPAVEWDRLSKAVLDKSLQSLTGAKRVPGGSTLATQIEKYRHSPEGRTGSAEDKLRQMFSASLRAYQDGEDTSKARRRIVIDYLNTVPLSAKLGYGEVNGIGDGMWVWYGRDFAQVNSLLKAKQVTPDMAAAYKEALSLMIAQRRPSYYLGEEGEGDLETLANSHLRVLAQEKLISPQLRDAALKVKLHPASHTGVPAPAADSFVSRKAANAVRNHLGGLLGDTRLYNVDRLDLTVQSTLDAKAQQAVTEMLRKLRDPEQARAAGLTGHQLLGNGDPAKVVYSVTLLERGEHANVLRVQADNFDQPLDINEGAKLDLGSTAKLRTLITYLDIIDQLHKKLEPMSQEALREVDFNPKDKLTQWALEYFRELGPQADRGLAPMLAAAMQRKYSANPAEGFFTGGGLHHFGNFKKEDNNKVFTVQEALRHSVNLVFVRLMRDVTHYYMFLTPGSSASLLTDSNDPRRADYLAKFADREGREFLARFYQKYKGKTPDEALKILLGSVRATPVRLATMHRFLFPQASLKEFSDWVNDTLNSPNELPAARLAAMYEQYALANMDLGDRGYLAGVHPLELWVVGHLRANPKASFSDTANASAKERQEVYAWLFNTHRKHAQDKRIVGMLELEAFLGIHRQWKKMGYPFDSLVPSYATSLGASADRPAALAEMMGIIVNGGVRKPVQRIDGLHFAQGTPYETIVKRGKLGAGEQVLAPEVARAVADAIRDVVAEGTARRVKNAFTMSDGQVIPLGGKTGTGDQRFDVYAPGGKLLESRFVNRSATFVFNIGERYFGSLTAYVHGPQSADYDFTSALPVQLLTVLAPSLMYMIEPKEGQAACRAKP